MDTSCAALMKLAAAVHGQGYKVALTGEGADEALAGYVWFKTQAIRDRISKRHRHRPADADPQVPPGRRSEAARPIGPLCWGSAGSGRRSRTCTS